MALEAVTEMSESRLLEEGGRAHSMTKRFDRRGNDKVHVQSLCGLMHLDFNTPYVHGYEQYLRAVLELKLDAPALEQAWLRCVFNVAAVNCDDHTKNLAFMLDQTRTWHIAPAGGPSGLAPEADHSRDTVDDETCGSARREPRRQMGGLLRLGTLLRDRQGRQRSLAGIDRRTEAAAPHYQYQGSRRRRRLV